MLVVIMVFGATIQTRAQSTSPLTVDKSIQHVCHHFELTMGVSTNSVSMCVNCGSTRPLETSTWSSWIFTGNSRIAGQFPHQYVENEQIRTGTINIVCWGCGVFMSSHSSSQTRWIRA